MPYELTTIPLPCGAIACRADSSGVITGEDADLLIKKLGAGSAHFGMPLLVLTQQMTKLTSEARKLFSRPNDHGVPVVWCAVVVTNPLIRVTVNFLLRVSRSAATIRMFVNEPDAIGWLDERVRMDGPTVAARP